MKLLTTIPQPSLAIYRSLLMFYPKMYRLEYGSQMAQVFSDCLGDAQRKGTLGLLQFWLLTIVDLAKTAIEQRIRKGFAINKHAFTSVSAVLLFFAGIFYLLSAPSQFEEYYSDAFGGGDLWYEVAARMVIPGIFLHCVGFWGFILYYFGKMKRSGKIILAMSLAGVSLMSLFFVLSFLLLGPWWLLMMLSMLLHTFSFSLFGILCLKQRVLSRWNGLPLFLGLPFSLYFFVGLLGIGLQESHFYLSERIIGLTLFTIFGLGWMLLGQIFFQDVNKRPQPLILNKD